MEILLPAVLLTLLGGFGFLVVRAVRRRRQFALPVASTELPTLATEQRITATVRRVWRDPAQNLPLVELGIGERRLIFCPTDHAAAAARYQAALARRAELALFGLATLAPGGVDAMREQIRSAEPLSPDLVTLVHEGQFENDYVVIGRVLSSRPDTWDDLPLIVYRVQVIHAADLTLVLELAVPAKEGATPLPDGSLAHGSARLFGFLADLPA
jgi:hypothetical protein